MPPRFNRGAGNGGNASRCERRLRRLARQLLSFSILSADRVDQYPRGMIARVYLVIHLLDSPTLVYKEAYPVRPASLRIGARAIGDRDLAIHVAQQAERESILAGEGGIVVRGIEAGAEDDDVVFVEVRLLIAEPATFGRSAGGVGPGVEPEQNLVSAQRCERHGGRVMRRKNEVRRRISNFHHSRNPP
jgi:hypothetical protein